MGMILDQSYSSPSNERFVTFKDERDKLLASTLTLPASVDLSNYDSPVTTQSVGSCTADATTNLFENLLNQKGPEYQAELSRMFLYYCSRRYLNLHTIDAGSSNRMSVRALANIGCCLETTMPYTEANALIEPTDRAVKEAESYRISEYYSIRSPQEMMNALAQNMPVVFAIYTPMVGGHSMLAVGYDRDKQMFKCKNSAGTGYNDDGYVYVSYDKMETMFDAFTFTVDFAKVPYRWYIRNPFTRALWKALIWIETHLL